MIRARAGPDRGRRVPRRAGRARPRGGRGAARRARDHHRPVEPGALDRPDPGRAAATSCSAADGAGRRRLAARPRAGAEGPDGRVPALGRAGRSTPTGSPTTTTGLIDALVADQRAEHVPTLETDVDLNDPDGAPPRGARGARVRRRASVTSGCGPSRSCPSSPSAAPSSGSARRFPDRPGAGGGDGRRRARRARARARARRGDRRHRRAPPPTPRARPVRGRPRPGRGGPVRGRRARRSRPRRARPSACCSSRATARRSTRPRSSALLALHRATVVIVPDRHGHGHQRAAADAAGRDGAGVRRGLVRAPRALAARGRRDVRGRRACRSLGARRRHARRPRGAAPRAGRRRRRRRTRALLEEAAAA